MSLIKKISETYNIAVLIVNQVMSDPSGMTVEKKPIGGNIMAHSSTTRLQIKKGKDEKRILKIYDSPNVIDERVEFAIGKGGVTDFVE